MQMLEMKKESEKKMPITKIEKIIEFLNETEKNLKEIEEIKESMFQLSAEIEDTYDIEDENESSNERARLEREHTAKCHYVDRLKKQISEDFSVEVAKDLIPFVRKLIKYTSSIQNRLDSIAYDARELSDENELDEFWSDKWILNEQKESVN